MRRLCLALLAAGACGCRSHADIETLGAIAPQFGSTPELSTVAGFVSGMWKFHMDTGTATDQASANFGRILNAIDEREMAIRKDGLYTVYVNRRHRGVGKWEVSGDGIDLTLVQMDGQPLPTERSQWEPYMCLNDGHLAIGADGRRLTQNLTRADGTPVGGMIAWERIKP